MCGIVGQVNRERPIDRPTLEAMRDTLVHRGPDGGGALFSTDGRVAVGHRRLSIIDLSSLASQPMTNEDGTVWLPYN